MNHEQSSAFSDGGQLLSKSVGSCTSRAAAPATKEDGDDAFTHARARAHKLTQTVISLLGFLMAVTKGGSPVRIYLPALAHPLLPQWALNGLH